MPRSFFFASQQADDLRRCRASSCSQRTPARRKRRRRQPGPDPLPQHRLHCLPPLAKKSPSAGRRTSRARSRSYARALLVGECPHDSPPAPGILFPALFPLFCLHLLPSLCSKQSRERKQLFVAALFASFVCCSCVYQNLAFINAVYLKKRNREGRRSSCRRSTKKARQQQHRQHLR